MINYNEKLKKYIMSNGFSVTEFGKLIGINMNLLNEYMSGTKELTKEYYELIEELIQKNDVHIKKKRNPKKLEFSKTIVLSCAIHKGGSGKTSVAVNTAYELSTMGYKVLLIDSDAQCNAASSIMNDFMKRDDVLEKNFYNAFLNKITIEESIISTDYENLDIVAGSPELANIEYIISRIVNSIDDVQYMFKNCISSLLDNHVYDFIICDLNPSLGNLNYSIMCASNEILIPAEIAPFATFGLKTFVDFYNTVKEVNKDIDIMGVVVTKLDKRNIWTFDILSAIDKVFPGLRMKSIIQIDTNIPKSQWYGLPVSVYNNKTRSVREFRTLTLEILSNCKKYAAK